METYPNYAPLSPPLYANSRAKPGEPHAANGVTRGSPRYRMIVPSGS